MPELEPPINHTVDAIYKAIAPEARGGDSTGVPMSDSGNECERAIWYKFRWSAPLEIIDGKKQLVFDVGLWWEARLLKAFGSVPGVQLWTEDPETGKQFSINLADGWLRGKMDGVAQGVPEAPKAIHVVECKSHNEKSFKLLLRHAFPKPEDEEKIAEGKFIKGLRGAKYDHWVQCQLYMLAEGLKRCVYLAVNKNNQEVHAERIEFDAAQALALAGRVQRITKSDRAPSRLHDDPTAKAAFACGWCPAKALCHEGEFARFNCRTCLHAEFRDGAVMWCTKHDVERGYKEQQAGCPLHRYLPDLVPGEQVDVDGDIVVYRLRDGSEWRDGGQGA